MRYAFYFAISVVCLTTGTFFTFDHISLSTVATPRADTRPATPADTLPSREVRTPPVPTADDYAQFADEDRAWRAQHARQYTVAELRARGDGRRTARDSVQDRVYALMRADQRAQAVTELERWVASHPDDSELLLSLARLLSETGRSNDAIRRYRQLLALQHRGE